MNEEKPSQFTNQDPDGTSANTPLPSNNDTPSLKLYLSIYTLPLRRFIDAQVNGNLSALIIESPPLPTEEQLKIAWENILMQYVDAVGSNEYKIYIKLMKELSKCQNDYEGVHLLISSMKSVAEVGNPDVLSCEYAKSICKNINTELKTSFKFDSSDINQYREDLKRCDARSRSLKIKYDLKKLEFDAIEKKMDQNGNEQKNTEAFFHGMLIKLSDHAKYRIDDSITVFEYCERLKRLAL